MSQRIIIRIDTEGATQVRTEGFRGNSCQAASRLLERALGRTTSEQLTSDYYQSSTTTGNQQFETGDTP
ncbi:DUF2997 domain-containing protein [Aureliella helgolandensis]|uniref:DUF2997 domain-containing protein n=1 Tax=Aureliella helgolandensis TaxID=2527968 RepID=A0A518G9M2_9BACT|nr:DUF2997 domain-containing protein [Aureliella helgolandensis]QDV25295.1 hypothetical protein Q31a_36190 [Aureliella helgolandensis]